MKDKKSFIRALLTFSFLLLASLLAFASSAAAALEFGHVRARTRGFVDREASTAETSSAAAMHSEAEDPSSSGDDAFEEEGFADDGVSEAWDQPIDEVGPAEEIDTAILGNKGSSEKVGWVQRGRNAAASFRTSVAFWKEEPGFKPIGKSGYLARGAPNAFRFSDDENAIRRPPSPALPEFSHFSNEYIPYVIEELLPEDAANDPSMLSEIVIEMEPHTVLSGKIDTRSYDREEKVEDFDLEEHRTSVLRPEEVLIFFETDGVRTEPNALIPFSPAQPSAETIESSARYKKE